MFQNAVLENSGGNRRALAAGAGFAGQAALAALIALAPMIWPQILPRPHLAMTIAPPPPVPMAPEQTRAVKPRTTQNFAPAVRTVFRIPTAMPAHPAPIADRDEPIQPIFDGIPGGIGMPAVNSAIERILTTAREIPKIAEAPQPKAPAVEIKRIRVSSLTPGQLVHIVQPVYPSIARSAHIEGIVELSAVIGTDGRVRELNVSFR